MRKNNMSEEIPEDLKQDMPKVPQETKKQEEAQIVIWTENQLINAKLDTIIELLTKK